MERYITFKALTNIIKDFTKYDKIIILEYIFNKDWLVNQCTDEIFDNLLPYPIILVINEIMSHDYYLKYTAHIVKLVKSIDV